jgi:hypothetical protein
MKVATTVPPRVDIPHRGYPKLLAASPSRVRSRRCLAHHSVHPGLQVVNIVKDFWSELRANVS